MLPLKRNTAWLITERIKNYAKQRWFDFHQFKFPFQWSLAIFLVIKSMKTSSL